MATTSGTSSPCGACKFLRRKCATDCIFAPYFSSEQGPARFAAIHKVFGASNVSKMLSHLPVADRCEAVVTIAYEAHSRVKDPVFGCVSHIFALQHQVAWLQGQVMQAKSQIAQGQGLIESSNQENMWPAAGGNYMAGQANSLPVYNYMNNYVSPGSSQESIDQQYQNKAGVMRIEHIESKYNYNNEASGGNCSFSKKLQSGSQIQLGELQEMANRMMRK